MILLRRMAGVSARRESMEEAFLVSAGEAMEEAFLVAAGVLAAGALGADKVLLETPTLTAWSASMSA